MRSWDSHSRSMRWHAATRCYTYRSSKDLRWGSMLHHIDPLFPPTLGECLCCCIVYAALEVVSSWCSLRPIAYNNQCFKIIIFFLTSNTFEYHRDTDMTPCSRRLHSRGCKQVGWVSLLRTTPSTLLVAKVLIVIQCLYGSDYTSWYQVGIHHLLEIEHQSKGF